MSRILKEELDLQFKIAGVDKEKLYKALAAMGSGVIKDKDERSRWTIENPTVGACYFVSEWWYWYLAPEGSRPYKLKVNGYNTNHRFCRTGNGIIVDLTAEQFDDYESLDYNTAKVCAFMQITKNGPSKRAKELAVQYGMAESDWTKSWYGKEVLKR